MKFLQVLLLGSAVSLCACSATSSPTSPSATTHSATSLLSADGFDPSFFSAFLQNGFESPDHLEPIRMLPGPFRVYVRTQDDAGRAINAATLDSTEHILIDTARIWSGDTFGIAEVTRGTSTKEKTPGWITVKWTAAATPGRCGNSTVGVDGGYIELNVSGSCTCGLTTAVYPRLVRHELGHAMGYYHTDDRHDVMYGQTITSDACDLQPSDRERQLARLAHTQ